MKKNKLEERHLKKTVIAAALILGASTLISQGFIQVASASEYNKTEIIPTNYADSTNVTTQTTVPDGYTKANYTVGSIDLEYYKDKVPTQKDLTKEEAAELSAQYLWQIYGANLEGQTIEMGYDTASDTRPRPEWTADVFMKNQDYHDGYRIKLYEVVIDSVTGEISGINMDRELKEKVEAGPDSSIDEDEFKAVAKQYAQKYNIVHSDIESIICTGQGASFPTNEIGTYGDPDISFEFHGTNGEVAGITISRYDKILKGISFKTISYEEMEKQFEEDDKRMFNDKQQNEVLSDDNTDESCLISVE